LKFKKLSIYINISSYIMNHSSTLSRDGWTTTPPGWNFFDVDDLARSELTDVDLSDYSHDYIMVLAGGLDHHGRNHPWVDDRLEVALELYRLKKRKIIILGGGTYHKPPHMNREKFVIHESTMGAKYLIDRGVDKCDLYREWASYDTIANAFYSLLNFVIPLRLKKILVITSDFHMDRSKYIFEWLYQLWSVGAGGGGDGNGSVDDGVQLSFLPVKTDHLDTDIIEARAGREARSLVNLKETTARMDTFEDFHGWFYREHQAYNCDFEKSPHDEDIDDNTRRSY